MDRKARLLVCVVGTMALVFGAFVLFTGCQKEKPMVGTQAAQTKTQETTPMKHEATPAPSQQVAQTAEQTNCPVMGGAIDKSIFVEYQGKKVYFCCNGCPDMFKANPEKYISKLPQFAK